MKTLLQPDRGAQPRQTTAKPPNAGLAVAALGLLIVAGVCVGLSFNDQVEESVYSPTSNSSNLASASTDRTFPAPAAPSPVAPSAVEPSPAAPSPVAPASPTAPAGGGGSASASADHPFVNSLGMKFAPVEITGGPTNGKRVLFSVWDTRVQDYAEFAREKGFAPEQTSFEQGPTHPVVSVSWQDAKDFCGWLTNKDRAAGKIGKEEEYRLPSDHEWSCAVGIGRKERAQASPESKRSKLGRVYPWGTQWPPPKGAGNYDPKLNADDFEYTSPVGSFAPNQNGLYDMGGNAWQWCEDLFDSKTDRRVLRGGAWHYDLELCLRSSFRADYPPTYRNERFGFRCVLVNPADTAKPASGKPSHPTAGPNRPPNGAPNRPAPVRSTPAPGGPSASPSPTSTPGRETPAPGNGPSTPSPKSTPAPRTPPPRGNPGSLPQSWYL